MIWTGPRIRLDDEAGIKRLQQVCRRLAERAAADEGFRAATAGLDVPRIFRLIRDRIAYRHDPRDVELVVAPIELLRRMQAGAAVADCEDIATLAAAIALVNGIRARLVAYGTGRRWYHIACELQSGGRWIAVDPVAGKRIDSRPTLARARNASMDRTIMVEGVGGWQEFLASSKVFMQEAPGYLAQTAGSLVDTLSPGFEAYTSYQTLREQRKLAEAQVSMPGATVKYITAPAAAPAAVPGVTLVSMPAAPAARPPAAGLGIDTKTLLIGGAVLAALLLLKGK